VVVNDDQLSLAIGKRGQNVRLAARLTGWDIDILTPAEFQAGVKRLEETLKGIEGITGDMVDKCIALGLIDVRDIEEVGVGPLMEEIGMDEPTATRVVQICGEVAKVVAVEQIAKKEADSRAKAAAANESKRALDALLGVGEPIVASEHGADDAAGESSPTMPGAMEAAEGGSPEVTVHRLSSGQDNDELSPEEQAVHGEDGTAVHEPHSPNDEESDVAALAEGRSIPPGASGQEPR
jgi:N utilization substance protein A